MADILTADYAQATLRPSPNYGARRGTGGITMLIMHYTGMESAEAAEQHLQSPESMVSAHYVVREDGAVVQMVAESARAWHAGESFWQGERDINSRSIGIEVVNAGPLRDFPAFPHVQIAALVRLSADIIARHGIGARHVLAHSDIAPMRKIDPGEKFPWDELALAGIGHFVPPQPVSGGRFMARGESGRPVEALQSMLSLYGYGLEISGIFDEMTESVIRAFQRHFRPMRVDGVADASTIATLHHLLAALQAL
ncbi:MAG: Peptidoglycan binding protein [Candidatus Tokpelaia hoelldobleri]|uniref:N-acetylmuramoyl-L-alanine amidase n=1 Tax=Candidatus Tokpelaia hoelldobleri TaxID=1902579 RepID=A0A1U9JWD5_9HYPH|nr:MAG: Peptidoglycan binding protein [Candidatus Tokpelaia hoelldoblerii]